MEPNSGEQHSSSSSHSWWWGSRTRPPHSQWLHTALTELDTKIKTILELIEDGGDSFAERAEMYYKRRPELIRMVQDLHRSYRALADKYDQLKSESLKPSNNGSVSNSFRLNQHFQEWQKGHPLFISSREAMNSHSSPVKEYYPASESGSSNFDFQSSNSSCQEGLSGKLKMMEDQNSRRVDKKTNRSVSSEDDMQVVSPKEDKLSKDRMSNEWPKLSKFINDQTKRSICKKMNSDVSYEDVDQIVLVKDEMEKKKKMWNQHPKLSKLLEDQAKRSIDNDVKYVTAFEDDNEGLLRTDGFDHEFLKPIRDENRRNIEKKINGFGHEDVSGRCDLEKKKIWKDQQKLSKLIEENLSHQAELIRRNDEKRELINELRNENRMLRNLSVSNTGRVGTKTKHSRRSKLKGLFCMP